jgi:hypothetical protein
LKRADSGAVALSRALIFKCAHSGRSIKALIFKWAHNGAGVGLSFK